MAIKYWVKEGGKSYCEGPEEEFIPEMCEWCAPRPDQNHDWIDGKWVLNEKRLAAQRANDSAKLSAMEKLKTLGFQESELKVLGF